LEGRKQRIDYLIWRFRLSGYVDKLTEDLPLGIRQRLSLAVAVVHQPEPLILDEPTSGVDPIARDGFWELLVDLSQKSGVTIFVSTHFMNEAARCDHISLMDAGRVLATDTPANLVRAQRSSVIVIVCHNSLTPQKATGSNRPPSTGTVTFAPAQLFWAYLAGIAIDL
jgi:ribosome-dependent ATPase